MVCNAYTECCLLYIHSTHIYLSIFIIIIHIRIYWYFFFFFFFFDLKHATGYIQSKCENLFNAMLCAGCAGCVLRTLDGEKMKWKEEKKNKIKIKALLAYTFNVFLPFENKILTVVAFYTYSVCTVCIVQHSTANSTYQLQLHICVCYMCL